MCNSPSLLSLTPEGRGFEVSRRVNKKVIIDRVKTIVIQNIKPLNKIEQTSAMLVCSICLQTDNNF